MAMRESLELNAGSVPGIPTEEAIVYVAEFVIVVLGSLLAT